MKNSPEEILHPIEKLRGTVLGQITALLESQNRTNIFSTTISALIHEFHARLTTDLKQIEAAKFDHSKADGLIQEITTSCGHVDRALALLFDEHLRQSQTNGEFTHALLLEFNQTIENLAHTLISKELMERQSQVLERIILNHERIAQWQEFVQEILRDFHAIFPFNFFFIAFTEEQGLSLYLYYMGNYSREVQHYVRQRLTKDLLDRLELHADTTPDIYEYQVLPAESDCRTDEVRMITVSVPDQASHLAGLLGVAFASTTALTSQEISIIRSILSVMVMVVGSSKALSRTLNELEYYSAHDPLTGLHNRRHFNEMLEYEIGRSSRHHHEFSILMLDLDDFKDVNDSYGHLYGDEALRRTAEVLHHYLRKGDIATRLGGDEFAVILTETSLEGAQKAAQNLLEMLRALEFKTTEGKRFRITASIGVACFPKDAENFADLMAGVDIALYRAKRKGKGVFCALDASAENSIRASREVRENAEKLRTALHEDRIIPYFQPIADCRSGEIYAYEALARLLEPNGEVTSAGRFIETMEKYGLCLEMDRIIIRKALLAKQKAIAAGRVSPRLFFNLSPQEIQGRGILGYVEKICNQLDIPPAGIVFEITERDAISDMTNMRKFLANLRGKGFAFALDDFGSGYNSFHYLRELHFEYVKIDGAFVRNLLDSKVDYHLIENLCRLCNSLGISTIAEFVESEKLLSALQEMGVDYVQGFHIGLPASAMDVP